MSDEGRQVGGRYRLDRRIGSGAMGVVWQAYDQRLRRTVAVKQLRLEPGLDPQEANEARERAMREGRIAARLQHPNAVSVFDVVDEDDAPWLVMEYVPSRSLADEMTERGMLPPIEVARIGAQVAHALAAAHAAGIVHRDIKPANILLAETGVVKITDFGISRAQGDVAVTKTGLIAGTPAFLAPEVAYGRSPGGPSDVFSLGSTLYAAVEGQPPFGMSENTLGLLHKVAAGEIDPPRQAGPLTDVLIHLLDADPDQRPDAVAASRWLDSVARGSRPNMPPIGMGPTAVMGGQRPPTARTTPLQPAGRTAVAGAAPMGETRAMTGRTGYQTGAQSGYRTQSGRPAAPPPRRNNRNKLLAGLGVGAVVILGVVLLLSGAFSGSNSPQTTPVDHTTTTTQSQAQNPLPNPVLTPYTISQDTRPPRTEDSATQTTTTETTTETTTTTTTTTQPTTTTTTTTTAKSSSSGNNPGNGGNPNG